jgi:hypothetical protein
MRQRSKLVAGKKRPEQTFGRWENTYCKPSLDVVHLARRVKEGHNRHRQEYTGQLASLVRREETTKYREDYESRTRPRHNQKLQQKQQIFANKNTNGVYRKQKS